MNRQLWLAVEPHIRRAQPSRRRLRAANGTGWITDLYSPLVPPGQDTRPSFSVLPDDDDAGAWKDFGTDEGGSLSDLCQRLGIDVGDTSTEMGPEELFMRWARQRCLNPDHLVRRWGCKPRLWFDRPAITFPTPADVDRIRYVDGQSPKTKWRRRGGKACWYGLQQAMEHSSDGPLYIVNGEPSVWACDQSGVPAVCTCMAEIRLPPAEEIAILATAIGPRPVRVVYDLDDAGRRGAAKLVAALRRQSVQAGALMLPEDLGEHGDVDDLHRRTGDDGLARALLELPRLSFDDQEDDPPTIVVTGKQLHAIVGEAWRAIHLFNDPPQIFQRLGSLVRLSTDTMRLEPLTHSIAYGYLSRTARWCALRRSGDDEILADRMPVREVAADMLAFPDPDLPHIDGGMVASPVLDQNGRVLDAPGYHRHARLWIDMPEDTRYPAVPDRPSPEAIAAARSLLLDDLLVDFPFCSEADRAHAVAMLLLPFVRRLISGCTPLHLLEAPCPGSGKGLLAHLACLLATGAVAASRTLPTNDDETRKMLTAELLAGRPLILLDNASEHKSIDNPSLVSALTSETWTDRLLGASQMMTASNRAVWILTGNNPRMSLEMARRCVRIRIDPRTDRPWQREGFRHDPLLPWATENRPKLVHACLTLGRAWVAAGRPMSRQRLGSFEQWASIMGGILEVAGISGFLANLEELYESADAQGQEWREFITAWRDRHTDRWVSTTELHQLAADKELLSAIIGDRSERSQRTRLGRALGTIRDRQFDGWTVKRGEDKRKCQALYRLVGVADDDLPAAAQEEIPF